MPTYTKETALYDTGKISTDITSAGQTASKYITAVDQNGIKVHAENAPNSNYSLIDGDGLTVYKSTKEVARFGDTTRIGKLDSGNLLAQSNGIAVRDGLTELATFSASGSQIGGDAGKNVQVVPDAIKFNDGSDQIAGMYSYINTMDLGGGDTLTNAGTNFALSGEYNTDTGTWDTPHHAMMSGIHVVNTESPGLVNDIAEIEAFAENEQDSSKTSRSSMQTTASDMGLASYDVSLRVGTDFKHISYQLLNTGSSSLSIEADSFDISNNFIVDQNGNLECNNVGVPKYLTNPTITKSTGSSTCSVVAYSGYGKMRMLILAFTATATISSGANVFTGTITTTDARPKIAAGGSGFYGSAAVIGNINASGTITIRMCGGSISSGGTIWVYFTYFVA